MRTEFFKRFMALLFIPLFCAAGFFAGCSLLQFEEYKPNNFEEGYVEPDYEFSVACTEDKTIVKIGDVGELGDFANVVYAKPYEYLADETEKGVSTEEYATKAEGTQIGKYECGTADTVEIDRYETNEQGDKVYDTVYCKFYVVNDQGHILAGPVYPTDIEPEYKHESLANAQSIKGVFVNWGGLLPIVQDLGCDHVEINCWMEDIIVPLETVDEETGEITPIDYAVDIDETTKKGTITGPDNSPQAVEAFDHNGKTYYFRTAAWGGRANLDYYDSEIKAYTDNNIKVTLLFYLTINKNQLIQPYFLTYKEVRNKSAGLHAINTSNPYGAGYWAAFTEFMANRYSDPEGAHGEVESFVLSNEIDQSTQWNCTFDKTRLSTETYVTEFERMLRITNQSFKKVHANNIALVPITHWWNANGGGGDYNPKDIVDALCAKTRKQGNYNWGLAVHPYGATLSVTNFWSGDVGAANGIDGTFETKQITWTNLEVLQLYLEQKIKLFDGKVRDVYVTEGGVSSSLGNIGNMRSEDKLQQAAGIAYAYYKCTQLSCIKALNYYLLIDNAPEGARFGLMEDGTKLKASYYVYKDIDTPKSFETSEEYLNYITWTIFENGSYTPHGAGVDFDFSWQKAMKIVKSEFDWETHWDEEKIITKTASAD